MKIVEMMGPLIQCNCGCNNTYFRSVDWQQHYLKDILPASLAKFIEGPDANGLVRDVDDPRNFKLV